VVEGAGFVFNPPRDVVPNSQGALRVGELARDRGSFEVVHEGLMTAYWSEAQDIGDPEVLVGVAGAAGLPRDDVLRAIQDPALGARIRQSTAAALELGVTGVPAWIIGGRAHVPGAQPHQVFDRVLGRLGFVPVDTADAAHAPGVA
jgi:predicted DsbA family dithiol-disulfide isomerase